MAKQNRKTAKQSRQTAKQNRKTERRATTQTIAKVLVVGGGANFTTCEIYDPGSEFWTYTGNTFYPRTQAATILLANGKVLVVAGNIPGPSFGAASLSAELYHPVTGQWY